MGCDVKTASNKLEAIELASSSNFDLYLVDLRLPKDSGIEITRALRHISSNTNICILSSYLHLDEWQSDLRRVRFNYTPLDKDIPPPDSPAFSVFANKLKELARQTRFVQDHEESERAISADIDPFNISFRSYMNLPAQTKKRYRETAYRKALPYIESAFNSGKVWVLFCGDSRTPAMSASTLQDIPNSRDVAQIAFDKDRAPFQFSAPMGVDDLTPNSCQGTSGAAGYPTITLQFSDSEPRRVHFDTGAPITFFSFEYLNEVHDLSEYTFDITASRGRQKFDCIKEELNLKMLCQISGKVKMVVVDALIVKDWDNSPFRVSCDPKCKSGREVGKLTCRNRQCGLLGRDIMYRNNISISLNHKGAGTQISTVRKKPQ